MSQESLLKRIQRLPRLTPSEVKIADFFQRNLVMTAFETATSISQQAGVSKATVVRFIAKLGFEGFNKFREQLHQEVLERIDKPIDRFPLRKQQRLAGGDDHLSQNITSIMRNLQEMRSRISAEQFQEAARLLALNQGAVYIVGNLSSFGLAYYFWSYACYLRDQVYLLDNLGSTLPTQLVQATSKDLLFAVTQSRYSQQTLITVEHFFKLGARIIQVVDVERNPISDYSTLTLVAPSEIVSLFNSSCAALAVLESLLAEMSYLLEKNIYQRLEMADGLLGSFSSLTKGQFPSRSGGWETMRSKRLKNDLSD